MSFFPAEFDPRGAVVWVLDMAAIDTPDGVVRCMIGTDGVFTDTTGARWDGSQLISLSGFESAINGVAPAGQIGLSFYQDPAAPSLIESVRAYGADYLDGRPIDFYLQPLRSAAEFSAPTLPPLQWARRTMRTITISKQGPLQREISVGFEAWSEGRRTARRIALNTEGHAALIGEANPSLEYIPTTDFTEEKLWT